MSGHRVSVIIPVFNDGERLKCCLEALAGQRYEHDRLEVIVVDNGSSPPIAETFAGQFPGVIFAVESQPGSYAARNRGLKLVTGDVIAFTDADCIPDPSWIEEGVKALHSKENCGLAAGRVELLFPNPEQLGAAEMFERIIAFPQRYYVEGMHFGATANAFTFAEVFHRVGPFNAELMSSGDFDWGKRVYRAGYCQVYADNAVVCHPARASLGELIQKQRRVAGGAFTLEMNGRGLVRKTRRVASEVARRLFPRLSELDMLWSDQRHTRISHRVKVIAVRFVLNYAYALEYVRLALGGKPKR